MKNLFNFNKNNSGFESLNESEMLNIRGGSEPTKPISKPRDIWDEE